MGFRRNDFTEMIMEESRMNKVVFIGAGSMAEAMISGWINNNTFDANNIYISNRSDINRLLALREKYGVQILTDIKLIQDADLIVLAMKPKDIREAMEKIKSFVSDETAVLTILAGISISTITDGLGMRPVARVMPNTSATIGMSASGISFNELITEEKKQTFMTLLQAIGLVIEVEEDQLHVITALSGSGPAYIYYLIEAFEQVGTQFGLSKEIVRDLMVQTIAGSASMLSTVKEEPAILRQKVTSPGGTTEAGIKALEQNHFIETIFACVQSAEARSRELSKGV